MASKGKWMFRALVLLFFLGLVGLAVDISRKTRFPGSKHRLKPDHKEQKDTLSSQSSPKTATKPE